MNDLTLLVGQTAGPILVAMGIGILFNGAYYASIYKSLRNESTALLLLAILTTLIGILIVMKHKLWGTAPEIIVSLFGWAALIKGILILSMPNVTNTFVEKLPLAKILPFAGIVVIILGGYLSWFAYF